MRSVKSFVLVAVVVVLAVAAVGAIAMTMAGRAAPVAAPRSPQPAPSVSASAPTDPATSEEPQQTAPPSSPPAPPAPATLDEVYAAAGVTVPAGPVERAGCPPPPAETPPGGGPTTPWTPPATVPDDQLPAALPPTAWTSSTEAIEGTGMWIWQYSKTEGEDFAAIVDRAVAANLDHIWVRVGDSRDGFYAAERMDTLVPLAHAAGLDVIGWGFPFLHDPVADAAWTAEVLDWRGPDGRGLDGFSPDIETSTEGVKLSSERAAVYLGLVRQHAGDFPIHATVYPAVDWIMEAAYPFERIAPYVDSFVPMGYWMCEEPGAFTAQSLQRLRDLRPVHMIGQAFGNRYHGRRVAPSGAETLRFLDVAVREGAVGASLWVWQDMGQEQWDALASYPWHEAVRVTPR